VSRPKQLSYAEIARVFFVVGATCYGGMAATLLRTEKELGRYGKVLKMGQLDQLADYAYLMPGSSLLVFVSSVGGALRGFGGAVVASITYLLIPTISTIALGALYFSYRSIPDIVVPLRGMTAALVGVMAWNGVLLAKRYNHSMWLWLISALAAVGMITFGLHGAVIVMGAGLLGVVLPHPQAHGSHRPKGVHHD
jgi:chromate transporter